MSRVTAWLRARWQWLALGFVVVLGALGIRRRRRLLGHVRDELALARARQEVARLEANREALERDEARSVEAVEWLDEQIYQARARAVYAHEGGTQLRGTQLADAFEELGF